MENNLQSEYYQQIVTNANDCIVTITESGIIHYINPAVEKLFGYSEDELVGRNINCLMSATDNHCHDEYLRHYRQTGHGGIIGKGTREVIALHRDGRRFSVGLVVNEMRLESGECLYLGTMRDISWRKKIEYELRKSEERFELITRGTRDGIWDWDLKTNHIYFSNRWKAMLSYDEPDVEGTFMALQALIHPDDLGLALQEWVACMDTETDTFSFEYRLLSKQGNYVWVHCRGLVLLDDGGEAVRMAGSHTDITPRKRHDLELAGLHANLEKQTCELKEAHDELQLSHEQLLQSEKLASIGQLAAGVAHEINNPVGYVSSNLSTLQKYVDNLCQILEGYEQIETLVDQDHASLKAVLALKQELDIQYLKDDVRDLVDESREGISRVKGIVQDLKDFSHVDETEWQWIDLHQGLDSTLNIVNNEIKYKAEVVKEYGDVPEVECLAGQLNQVFMNLLVNAAQAIEAYGVITVGTGHDNQQAWVTVSDNGAGIDPENLNKIFDPFFTTKAVGSGTGLGLSLSYSIVRKHGGTISVDSELGKGTTFTVRVPLRQSTATAA